MRKKAQTHMVQQDTQHDWQDNFKEGRCGAQSKHLVYTRIPFLLKMGWKHIT